MHQGWALGASLAGILLTSTAVQAIVIADGDGNGAPTNNTAPVNDPGWNRVGSFSGGTGVYLGNGWVLTAAHVTTSGAAFTLNGSSYQYVSGSGQILNNPAGSGLSAQTDLWMGQYVPAAGSAPLPAGLLTIRSSTPAVGTLGTMIGTGQTQTSPNETRFYVDTDVNPYQWAATSFPEANVWYSGFYRTGPRDKRWATAPVTRQNGQPLQDRNILGRDVRGFGTNFKDEINGGIVVDKDSGSPLFIQNGSTWELAGIAHALLMTYRDQGTDPDTKDAVMYGNFSFYSDLSYYAGQINGQVVPEPASLVLLVALGGGLLARPRTRRQTP